MQRQEALRKQNMKKIEGLTVDYAFGPYLDVSERMLDDIGIQKYRKPRIWDEISKLIEIEDFKLVVTHRV